MRDNGEMAEQVIITTPDGKKRPISKGTRLKELADQWDKEAIAAHR